MKRVSEHISYGDAIRSDTATKHGINNYFTPEQLSRMVILANKVYEPLVVHFGKPVYITSFFRNKKINELIGGAANSQHMANSGAAIDLDGDMTEGVSNKDIFTYIQHNLEFDQLILEDIKEDGSIGWVHVSYKEGANRGEMLRMIIKDGYSTYEPFDGFEEEEPNPTDVITVPTCSTEDTTQNILLVILIAVVVTIPITLFILYKKLVSLLEQLFKKKETQKNISLPPWFQFKVNFVMVYKLVKKLLKKTRHVFKKDIRVV